MEPSVSPFVIIIALLSGVIGAVSLLVLFQFVFVAWPRRVINSDASPNILAFLAALILTPAVLRWALTTLDSTVGLVNDWARDLSNAIELCEHSCEAGFVFSTIAEIGGLLDVFRRTLSTIPITDILLFFLLCFVFGRAARYIASSDGRMAGTRSLSS